MNFFKDLGNRVGDSAQSSFDNLGNFLQNPVGGLVNLFRKDTQRLDNDNRNPTAADIANSGPSFEIRPTALPYSPVDRGVAENSAFDMRNTMSQAGISNPAASLMQSNFNFSPVGIPSLPDIVQTRPSSQEINPVVAGIEAEIEEEARQLQNMQQPALLQNQPVNQTGMLEMPNRPAARL